MIPDEVNKIFSDVVRKWRTADSQRTIFGVSMPQTMNAIKHLCEGIKNVFDIFPSFSLVKKGQDMEIVVKLDNADKGSAEVNIPANFPSMPKIFDESKITSITLKSGITADELQALFAGMSLKPEEIAEKGGLTGFLKDKAVEHISIDQLQFKLLKDGEEASADGKGKGKGGGKESSETTKLLESTWSEYLNSKLNKISFEDQHRKFIDAAIEDPKKIEKVLKRLLAKQKEAEKFLAQLEQKLFDVGFPPEAVEALKKKLLKPKKVSIDEDELARLRKIEKEYLKNTDGRIQDTLETIDTIKKKLSDETARSEAIVHQMGQGGVVLDADGKIVSVNRTAAKILGLSEDDVRGKRINEILKSHHIMTTVNNWQDESDTHTPKEVQMHAQNDETLAIIRESSIVIENETGRSIGVVSALQNVTQQEDLNQRKNDILDVLGHDLRSPLSAIKMNFDILEETAIFDKEAAKQQKKFMANCQTSIERLGKLIDKILDTRQLETGKIMIKYDTIKMDSLIEQAVTAQNQWAENKKIKLNITANQLPDIEGDPERIYQVITNLVSNALKFTPEGGTITTTGKTITREGVEYIEIAVIDTGMGISEEDVGKVFDKYSQVTAGSTGGVRGLGLGLSICKNIIELHGGAISVSSELGSGSTFTFQVPIKPRDKEQ